MAQRSYEIGIVHRVFFRYFMFKKMQGTSITEAYSPQTAKLKAQCMFGELLYAPSDTRGEWEFACMHGSKCTGCLAQHDTKFGMSTGMCGGDYYGITQPCEMQKPWLRPPESFRCEKHEQLENVMGLNTKKMAHDQRSFAATMGKASAQLNPTMGNALFGSCPRPQDPIQQMQLLQYKQGSALDDLMVLLLVLILVGGAVAGFYFYYSKK
jgi:hypothetical protein